MTEVERIVREGLVATRTDLNKAARLARRALSLARGTSDRDRGLASRLSGHVQLLRGIPGQAVSHYEEARRQFSSDPRESSVTAIAMLQGLAYLGRYEESFQVGTVALEYFLAEGDSLRAARVRVNLANALHRLDRLAEAREMYQQAKVSLEAEGTLDDIAICARNYAVCLMALGEVDSAWELYRQARCRFEAEGQAHLVLEVDLNEAFLLGRVGRLREALLAYRRLGDLPGVHSFELGHCFLDQADFLLGVGLYVDCIDATHRAEASFRRGRFPLELGKARLLRALALIRSGDLRRARVDLARARAKLAAEPNSVWAATAILAEAELTRKRGHGVQAQALLEGALEMMPAHSERREDLLMAYSSLLLESGDPRAANYIGVLKLDRPGALALKMRLAQSEGRDAIALARATVASYDAYRDGMETSGLRQGVRRAEGTALLAALENLRDPHERFAILQRLKTAGLAERMLLDRSHGSGDFGALRNYRITEELSTSVGFHRGPEVPPGSVFLEFATLGLSLVCVRRDERGLLAELDLGPVTEWTRLVQFLRMHLARGLRCPERQSERILARLRDEIGPWVGRGNLIIGRDPEIVALPWHAVFPDRCVTYCPGFAAWQVLAQRRSSRGDGVGIFGSADHLAPEIQKELADLRTLHAPKLRGEALADAIGSCNLLHLAAHGLFRADQPLLSSMKIEDEEWTALRFSGYRMRADLVLLSGCHTGLSASGDLTDVEGLVETFLVAGARNVVASLWDLDDELAATWTRIFHRHLHEGLTRAFEVATNEVRTVWTHPAQWGAFALFGVGT